MVGALILREPQCKTRLRYESMRHTPPDHGTRMMANLVARASIDIDAPPADVWKALTDPDAIEQYMFGSKVTSDWEEGASISWEGEWKGERYRDKGSILQFNPERLLQYTHFSPLSGLPDSPENYHTVTIELTQEGTLTRVWLSQDKNPTEEARRHSEENWNTMLAALKDLLET